MHFKIWQIPFQNKTKVSPPFLPAGQGREEEEEEYRGGSFESSHSLEKEEGERVTGEEGEREAEDATPVVDRAGQESIGGQEGAERKELTYFPPSSSSSPPKLSPSFLGVCVPHRESEGERRGENGQKVEIGFCYVDCAPREEREKGEKKRRWIECVFLHKMSSCSQKRSLPTLPL